MTSGPSSRATPIEVASRPPTRLRPRMTRPVPTKRTHHDQQVRDWLTTLGAPLGPAETKSRMPSVEEAVGDALSLAHRDATVARVLPLVLWRQRDELDFDRLIREATRRDERQALGYFLELAGQIGGEPRLVVKARASRDRRRKKVRMFFAGPHGPRAFGCDSAKHAEGGPAMGVPHEHGPGQLPIDVRQVRSTGTRAFFSAFLSTSVLSGRLRRPSKRL